MTEKTKASQKDAESWCKGLKENTDNDKSNDWYLVSGNLNEGAEGALKDAQGVYLAYQTTTDPKEAVTDLAVMNENGSFSTGDYDILLQKQIRKQVKIK